MTDDLTAAVARLREYADTFAVSCSKQDVRIVLSALEAARAAMPPREPTQAMVNAGYGEWMSDDKSPMRRTWRAMYDAWTQEQTSRPGVPCESPRSEVSATTSAADGNVGTEDATSGTGRIGRTAPGPLDPQNGVQRDAAYPGCALGASSLESGNAREATCLSGDPDARQPVAYTAGTVRDHAGSTPAAPTDPIADLCAELRATHCSNENLHDDAADALERLARERDEAAAAMRERCAQACEELSLHYDGQESEASSRVYADLCRGSRNGADACAAAIRALEAAQAEQTSGSTEGRAAIGMEPAKAMPERGAMASPTAGIKPGPLDHQSAAGTNCAAECAARASESSVRGPAADPIADLCARLRVLDNRGGLGYHAHAYIAEAADALERLARERKEADARCTRFAARWEETEERAERAEVERDTLRAIVRAADAMRATGDMLNCDRYDRARAAWKGEA